MVLVLRNRPWVDALVLVLRNEPWVDERSPFGDITHCWITDPRMDN
jgi:hypothetical protein